jgi:hypothetical protein
MKFLTAFIIVFVISALFEAPFKSALYWLFPGFFTAPKPEADSDIKNDK